LCRVKFPVPCSLGDLGTAAGCDIGNSKDLEEKPAQIESVELVVSDSFLMRQWYQQLIVSSTEIRASALDPDLDATINCACRIHQLVASFAKPA
jgi:hypothetical protein